MTNKIHIFYNAKCANCKAIEEEMRRVGAVTFCPSCCDRVFESDDPVRKEREKYLTFLHLQNDQDPEV